jgi:hypothetical protein
LQWFGVYRFGMRDLRSWAVLAAMCVPAAVAQHSSSVGVAQTPPMGWNSWDAYGLRITEPQFKANVYALQKKLRPFGYNYAVIDEGWFFENPQDRGKPETLRYALDPHGRYVPVPARFPSAVLTVTAPVESPAGDGKALAATIEETSFAGLGRWVHAQGLKFGIHIVRGIPRASVERNLPIEGSEFHAQDAADTTNACPWDPTNWGVKDNAAGQAWYDSLIRQYAGWGVDFLKVDCIAARPYRVTEIRMIRKAIDKAGRPMVLSLSPGAAALANRDEFAQLSNMWRISNDEWDVWSVGNDGFPQGVKEQFATAAKWAPFSKPGTWPDADMLPIGELRPSPDYYSARHSRLTLEEERTEITLWSMARSPLIVGANLTLLDEPTLKLLTMPQVIAIDQTAIQSGEVLHQGDLIVWKAVLPGDQAAVAYFNVGDTPLQVDQSFGPISGRLKEHPWSVRDVWAAKELGRQTGVSVELAPHACALYMLRAVKK